MSFGGTFIFLFLFLRGFCIVLLDIAGVSVLGCVATWQRGRFIAILTVHINISIR